MKIGIHGELYPFFESLMISDFRNYMALDHFRYVYGKKIRKRSTLLYTVQVFNILGLQAWHDMTKKV